SGLLILSDRPALGTPINDVLPPGDTVFDVEITPNRPDCLSHLGLARELAAWFRQPLRYPNVDGAKPVPPAPARPDLLHGIRVEAPEGCPLYTATVISGVTIRPSPAWLQARLSAIGLRPINNLVDVGNYVMLEYGQPMHAFDARKLGGASIVVRHATPGETIVTLDGKSRALNETTLVIADAVQPVVVAGIMGGENSGVDATTTDLVLEVAIFKRQAVRATAKRLGLSSDSSYRYERGVDPHLLPEATRRAIELILATAGGQVCGPTLRAGGDVPWQREIAVAPSWIREQLGFEVADAEMRRALEALELRVVREETDDTSDRTVWTVSVPSWRDDLDRPIDLVEEVLRLHGTEKIPAAPVIAPGLLQDDDPIAQFVRRTGTSLVGQGFNECVTYTLRPAAELSAWIPSEAGGALALANPFVEDQSHLRPTLLAGLLESLRLNRSRGVAASRLFETGRVFQEHNGQVLECIAVGFLIAEEDAPATWLKREPADFYTTKRLIETIAQEAGIDLARQPLAAAGAAAGWQTGHHAAFGALAHGWGASCGLLDLALTQSLGFSGKIYGGQFLVLPAKLEATTSRRRYQSFSLLPAALRDLAIVVDDSQSAGEVQKALLQAGRRAVGNAFALERVQVFDVYRGQGLPAGKKSLAFSLTFRSADRTLTDDEVNVVFNRLQTDLIAAGYTIRK
ncbi:MAG TPA: phenylalanine--tRNA ligase subunit beta, partial [Candidatus Synoicihabitans sp.]|nr:phenylalanine--tRNA ligase subunit beta [Candidatus Synoicihabitans sp.]